MNPRLKLRKKYEMNKHSQKTKMVSLFTILNEFDYGSRLNIGSGFNIIYRHLKQHEFIPCILPVLRDVSRKHGTGGSVQRNLEMRRRKITQIENRSEYQVIGSKIYISIRIFISCMDLFINHHSNGWQS